MGRLGGLHHRARPPACRRCSKRGLRSPALGRSRGGLTSKIQTGRPMDEPAAFRTLRRFAKAAGLPHADTLSPHSLRHSYTTAMLDKGVPLADVQDALGHADPRTTRRYDRARGALH
ncbi:tyrosine-type recombinase/integrase [Streptomyces sp. cg2]|uniref:tyrosine-type recombinase/integrase n=1 Tax=Streptomyces sp. cg2 TaxID=3238799 RepID=UPI0034E2467C